MVFISYHTSFVKNKIIKNHDFTISLWNRILYEKLLIKEFLSGYSNNLFFKIDWLRQTMRLLKNKNGTKIALLMKFKIFLIEI